MSLNNGKPGFGVCPHCKRWDTITDGHHLCRVCEGYEKPAKADEA